MWRYHEEGREKRITRDLKSLGPCPCGFDPRRPHQRDEYPSSACSHLSLGTQLDFVTARCGERQAGGAERFVLASANAWRFSPAAAARHHSRAAFQLASARYERTLAFLKEAEPIFFDEPSPSVGCARFSAPVAAVRRPPRSPPSCRAGRGGSPRRGCSPASPPRKISGA